METRKEDLRTIRTKQHLTEAFVELLQKRNIDEINIGDICNKAMVHRTTFYKHFKDKYDLLDYTITKLKSNFLYDAITMDNLKNTKQLCLKLSSSLIDYVDENRNFLLAVLKNNYTGILLDAFFRMIKKAFHELICGNVPTGTFKVPADVIANHYGGAIISLGFWRLENPNKYTKEQLIRYLDALIVIN